MLYIVAFQLKVGLMVEINGLMECQYFQKQKITNSLFSSSTVQQLTFQFFTTLAQKL